MDAPVNVIYCAKYAFSEKNNEKMYFDFIPLFLPEIRKKRELTTGSHQNKLKFILQN